METEQRNSFLPASVLFVVALVAVLGGIVARNVYPVFAGIVTLVGISFGVAWILKIDKILLNNPAHKSFRHTTFAPTDPTKKWLQFRKMDRREYGYTAVVGLLAGGIFRGVIGDTLAFAGLISGIIWIVQTIKLKSGKR